MSSQARKTLPSFKRNSKRNSATEVPSTASSSSASENRLPLPIPTTHACRWAEGTVVLAYGTTLLPPSPRNAFEPGSVDINEDGLWGWEDPSRFPQLLDQHAPYLAAIPIPDARTAASELYFREARKSDWMNLAGSPGTFRVHEENYVFIRQHTFGLVDDLEVASKMVINAFYSKGSAPPEDPVRKPMKYPQTARTAGMQTLIMMRYTGVRSWREFSVCWRAHQRAAHEITAFIDFLARLMPAEEDRSRLQNLESYKIYRTLPRRGVILSSKDLSLFFHRYRQLGLPVYVFVSDETYHVPAESIRQPSPCPVNLRIDPELNKTVDRDLPWYCYPSQGALWSSFEMVYRGILPQPVVFEPSGLSAKRARKLENSQKAMMAALLKQSSKERYEIGSQEFPAAYRRHLSTRLEDRLPWVPRPIYAYSSADLWALGHAANIVDAKLLTFFPPTSTFYNVQSHERLATYICMFVRLLPTLLHRITCIPTDGTIKPSGTRSWRSLLGVESFRNEWPKEERPQCNIDTFFKYGNVEMFGEKLTARINAGEWTPTIGKLACGCPATREIIKDDHVLISAIVFSINQWNLLHHLASLAEGSPILDFTRTTDETPVMNAIKQIVLGGTPLDPSGWPALWSFDSTGKEEHEKREWVQKLLAFFGEHAAPQTAIALRSKVALWLMNINHGEQEHLAMAEEELFHQYVACSFARGQWPCEFLEQPEYSDIYYGKCRAREQGKA